MQHVLCLRELDIAVRDDVEPVAPRIADVVAPDARAALAGGIDDGGDIVDDEPEVAVLAPWLDVVLEQRHELVTEVDERHSRRSAAQLQVREERAPELERLRDAAHVERDMVDPDRTCHREINANNSTVFLPLRRRPARGPCFAHAASSGPLIPGATDAA